MSTLGQKLKTLREQRGWTQEAAASYGGFNRNTYANWENDRTQPDIVTLSRLADIYHVTTDFLLGRNPGRLVRTIPILGQIRAGLPILAEENYEGGIEIPSDITADFALRVRGDSMIGAGILDGDYAICRKAETINAHSGQIVVAIRYEAAEYAEATLKYFFVENGRAVLRAANPDYEDIDFDEEGYHVAGIMVALLRYGAPDYRIYREYISTRDYVLQEWDEVIEKAATAGIKPSVIKELIDVQVEIAKRLKG
jgi:repressor LexA